jgi:hypothetical protein
LRIAVLHFLLLGVELTLAGTASATRTAAATRYLLINLPP